MNSSSDLNSNLRDVRVKQKIEMNRDLSRSLKLSDELNYYWMICLEHFRVLSGIYSFVFIIFCDSIILASLSVSAVVEEWRMGRKTWNFPSLWLHNIIYQLSPEHNLISQDSRLELVGSRDWGSLSVRMHAYVLCVCWGNLNFSSRLSPIVLRYKPAGNFKLRRRKKASFDLRKLKIFQECFYHAQVVAHTSLPTDSVYKSRWRREYFFIF